MFCLSRWVTNFRIALATLLGAGLGLILAVPVQAQIASYVDSHGRLIYVNANPPARSSSRTSGSNGQPAIATPPPRIEKAINAAAERNHLDPALVQAVIQTESDWNPYAVSRKGAYGLMQLIPATAERFGVGNVFDPVENINGGTRYLRELLDRYHGNLRLSLAAYNAGEQAVERFGGVPAYHETRAYVRKVTDTYFQSDPGHSPTGEVHHFSIREIKDQTGRTVYTNE
jgi:soluble lytic murein transglycosylase-like protein